MGIVLAPKIFETGRSGQLFVLIFCYLLYSLYYKVGPLTGPQRNPTPRAHVKKHSGNFVVFYILSIICRVQIRLKL